MDNRIKKVMMSLLWQAVIAASLFLVMFVLKRALPDAFNKCSAVWEKSTDFKKAGGLLVQFFKEIIPF